MHAIMPSPALWQLVKYYFNITVSCILQDTEVFEWAFTS